MELTIGGRHLRDVRLIVFDKDGTITDLYAYLSRVAEVRAHLLCARLGLGLDYMPRIQDAMGLDLNARWFKPDGAMARKQRADVLQAAIVFLEAEGQANVAAVCATVFAETDLHIQKELPRLIKVLPGVREFFATISGKCHTAVVTADNQVQAGRIMDCTGLKIDVIVGTDKVKKAKPDPEIVNVAMAQVGTGPLHTVIIGDTKSDVICGRNAGLLAAIGVTTGITSREELREHTEFVVDALSEIKVTG